MIAQTNLQLERQVTEQGWPTSDLWKVRAGLELATDVLGGALRASGKPFLCHVVGTASVVARHGGDADLVAAALAHAAYSHGDFGDLRLGRTRRRAAAVTRVIGARAEADISHYYDVQVSGRLPDRATERCPVDAERRLLLLVIANEVDDHLDGGMRVLGPTEREARHEWLQLLCTRGRRVGLGEAAELLRSVVAEQPDIAEPFERHGPKATTWPKPRLRSMHRTRPWRSPARRFTPPR